MKKYIPILEKMDFIEGDNSIIERAKFLGDGELKFVYYELLKVVTTAIIYSKNTDCFPKDLDKNGNALTTINLEETYNMLMMNKMKNWKKIIKNKDAKEFIRICDKVYEEKNKISNQILDMSTHLNKMVEKLPESIKNGSKNG